MDEREPARHPGIAEVREVPRKLGRLQHPLVDHRSRAEARQGEVAPGAQLDHPPDHVQLAFELLLIGDLLRGLDEHLADHRRGQARGVADVALVDRHVAPPDRALALGLDRLLDQLLELGPTFRIARQIADADAVPSRPRELDAGDRRAQERVRDLEQDAGAVAGVRIGTLGAAVLEVLERVERLLDHRVACLAVELCDQRDAARIVFVCGVVEASGPGWSGAVVHL